MEWIGIVRVKSKKNVYVVFVINIKKEKNNILRIPSRPCTKKKKKKKNRKIQGFWGGLREYEVGAQWIRMYPLQLNPKGADRDMGADQGQKRGGSKNHGKWRQMQAPGLGRRQEWRKLDSSRCGRRPCGRHFATGEEVGIRCYIEKGLWWRMDNDGGEVGWGRKRKIKKWWKQVGR